MYGLFMDNGKADARAKVQGRCLGVRSQRGAVHDPVSTGEVDRPQSSGAERKTRRDHLVIRAKAHISWGNC